MGRLREMTYYRSFFDRESVGNLAHEDLYSILDAFASTSIG